MNVREALEFAKKNKVQVVDLKFVDLIGTWQHFTIPVRELTEGLFKDGSGLDGSSIRGWKAINNSDMLMVPDPATACLDPFCAVPTLSLDRQRRRSDHARNLRSRPAVHCAEGGEISPEHEDRRHLLLGTGSRILHFRHARYDQTSHSGYYFIDSDEGVWNMGAGRRQPGRKDPSQGGLLPGSADRYATGHP